MKKNKRKKICEKDKNTTGKWLTDDTITGESEQTILNWWTLSLVLVPFPKFKYK